MNVNKFMLLAFFVFSIQTFSQKKDVYFVIRNADSQYSISSIMFDKEIGYINLLSRKEYEFHQQKVIEAKKKGTYYYDPNSGRDNLGIKVPTLTFEIISKKKIKITDNEMSNLKLVDYDWIRHNAWKKIGKQPHDFKNIYFLYKMEKDTYISYKVGMTIVAH